MQSVLKDNLLEKINNYFPSDIFPSFDQRYALSPPHSAVSAEACRRCFGLCACTCASVVQISHELHEHI